MMMMVVVVVRSSHHVIWQLQLKRLDDVEGGEEWGYCWWWWKWKWWQWCCWWLSHQAMWQLQLKGLDMRLSEVSEANSSKAPGVTQLISFPNKLKLFKLFRPLGRFSFSCGHKYEMKHLEKYFGFPQTQHWQTFWYLRYKYKYADAKCLPINYLKHGPVHSPDWILREKAETGTVELGTWEIQDFKLGNTTNLSIKI